MTKLHYFKVTFFAVGLGLTTSLLLWNFWELEAYGITTIGKAVLKSVFIGVFTAFILSVLNMYFKVAPFKKETTENKSDNNI